MSLFVRPYGCDICEMWMQYIYTHTQNLAASIVCVKYFSNSQEIPKKKKKNDFGTTNKETLFYGWNKQKNTTVECFGK